MTTFFTADEHYGHGNIIKYCDRPFSSTQEMDDTMIVNHNSVVGENDVTIHAGDFTFYDRDKAQKIINQLNGAHCFLKGSHDKWLPNDYKQIYEFHASMYTPKSVLIVVCHYCMRTWAKSHFNSWHLYGHSHGKLDPIGKSWDIGVDNNDFFPLSLKQIEILMKHSPDNFNLVKK